MTASLVFGTDGTVRGLHTDLIDLGRLGHLRVRRASRIEFNERRQVWEVLIGRRMVYCAPTRSTCLDWEARYFAAQEEA